MLRRDEQVKELVYATRLPSNPVSVALRSVLFKAEHDVWKSVLKSVDSSAEARGGSGGADSSREPRVASSHSSSNLLEVISSLLLLAHMIALANYDPTSSVVSSHTNSTAAYINVGLSMFYFVEIVLAFVCFGTRGGVLTIRFLWALADAIVVVLGVLSAMSDIMELSGGTAFFAMRGIVLIRAGKMFAPIVRRVNSPTMQMLVIAVPNAAIGLANVTLLLIIFILAAAIGMTAMYHQSLLFRCVNNDFFTLESAANRTSALQAIISNYSSAIIPSKLSAFDNVVGTIDLSAPSLRINSFSCGEEYDVAMGLSSLACSASSSVCEETTSFSLFGAQCPYGYTCTLGDKPPFDFLGYDNVLRAFYTTFVVISFSGWYEVLYALLDASGYVAGFYLVVTLIFGSFFVLKLAIVVITISFRHAQADLDRQRVDREKEAKAAAEAAKVKQTAGTGADAIGSSTMMMSPIAQEDAGSSRLGDPLIVPPPFRDETTVPLTLADTDDATVNKRQQFRAGGFFRFQAWLSVNVLHSRWFSSFITSVIVLNIIIMCTDRYNSPAKYQHLNTVSTVVFNSIYSLEIVLRLLGSPYVAAYFMNSMNLLDLVVVTCGWVDILLDSVNIPFIRSLRAIRILKLFKHFPDIYIWIKVLLVSIVNSISLLGMLLVFIFVFAIIGMQLFGGKMTCPPQLRDAQGFCVNQPRGNFDNFGAAILACFQIITADNWADIMYGAMSGTSSNNGIFFIVLYYVGNALLVNLIIGALLVARSTIGNKLQVAIEQAQNERLKQFQDGGLQLLQDMLGGDDIPQGIGSATAGLGDNSTTAARQISQREVWLFGEDALFEEPLVPERSEEELRTYTVAFAPSIEMVKEQKAYATMVKQSRTAIAQRIKKRRERDRFLAELDLPGTTFRVLVRRMVHTTGYKVFHGLATLGSIAAMIMFTPDGAPDTTLARNTRIADIVFAGLLGLDTLAMVLAYGLGFDHKSVFLRFKWQLFHFFVLLNVFVSVILRCVVPIHHKGLRAAWQITTCISAMRVFRLLEFSPPMKHTCELLLCAVRSIKNMLVVGFIVFTVWGLMGVNLFSGSFYTCSQSNYTTIGACRFSGNTWQKPGLSFDNIGTAFLSLFVMTTMDGWTDVMYSGIDANGPYVAPTRNSHPLNAVFFISFVIVSGIFLINLLVSVIIDEFEIQRKLRRDEAAESGGYLTPQQRAYLDTCRDFAAKVPHIFRLPARPRFIDRIRLKVWTRVATKQFEHIMHVIVVINLVPLCMDSYPESQTTSDQLAYTNIAFVLIYLAECVLKVFALQQHYFHSMWNLFDLALFALSAIGVIAELALPLPGVVVNAFRCVRVLRILRPIRSVKSLRKLMRLLVASVGPLLNVVGIVILTFAAFGVAGKILFGVIVWDDNINSHGNFLNILSAFLLLLRLSTMGGTTEILNSLRVRPPNCDPDIGNCSSTAAAGFFVGLFVFAGVFILRNLFTTVIVDTCHSIDADSHLQAKGKDAKLFLNRWRKRDPEWTLVMKTTELCHFLHSLPLTNGLALNFHIATLFSLRRHCAELRFIKHLGLKENEKGEIHLRHIIAVLCFQMYGTEPPAATLQALDKRLAFKFHTTTSSWSNEEFCFPAFRRLAVSKIEQYWLRHKLDYRLNAAVARQFPKTEEQLEAKRRIIAAGPKPQILGASLQQFGATTPEISPSLAAARRLSRDSSAITIPLLQLPQAEMGIVEASSPFRRPSIIAPRRRAAPANDFDSRKDATELLDLL